MLESEGDCKIRLIIVQIANGFRRHVYHRGLVTMGHNLTHKQVDHRGCTVHVWLGTVRLNLTLHNRQFPSLTTKRNFNPLTL